MINSKLLIKENREKIEKEIQKLLNKNEDFKVKRIIDSPRAVGDAAQGIIGDNLENIIKKFGFEEIIEYKNDYSRRAMEDVSFKNTLGNYFAIDIKTHNKSASFNMPNLISVDRLSTFYYSDDKIFVILLAEYVEKDGGIEFDNVSIVPIENFSWNCLQIGALGKGQIQIKNANNVQIEYSMTRKNWMQDLVKKMEEFYKKELVKVEKRIKGIERLRDYWNNK